MESHVNVVKSLSNIKTPEGRGRAWIRMALNEKILGTALHALLPFAKYDTLGRVFLKLHYHSNGQM